MKHLWKTCETYNSFPDIINFLYLSYMVRPSVWPLGAMLKDLETLPACAERTVGIEGLLAERGVDLVDFERWQRIDAAEIEAAAGTDRPRLKKATWDSLLEV